MRARLVFGVFVSCTIGADARLEGTIDTQGKLRGAAELDSAAAITKFDDTAPQDVGHQRMNIVAMMTFGSGWGPNGPRGSMFLGGLTIPSPSQLFGFIAGLQVDFDQHCVQFAGVGGRSMLLAQTRANNRVDQFGPNPQVTRWYHAASALAGWRSVTAPPPVDASDSHTRSARWRWNSRRDLSSCRGSSRASASSQTERGGEIVER